MARPTTKRPTTKKDSDRGKKGHGRRPCNFCRNKVEYIDYKDFDGLRRSLSERGKIRSRRVTGTCRRHQVQLAKAVKIARELALLPFVDE